MMPVKQNVIKTNVLVVVGTPLQYMNAVEYLHKSKIESAHLVVFFDKQRPKYIFENLPGKDFWQSKLYISKTNKIDNRWSLIPTQIARMVKFLGDLITDFYLVKQINKLLTLFPLINILVLGNPNDMWQRHLANKLGALKVVDCEDGAASMIDEFKPGISQKIRSALLFLRSNKIEGMNVFSAYSSTTKQVIANDYSFLRETMLSKEHVCNSSTVWFLGQPLYTLRILTLDEYILVLSSIFKFAYKKNDIVYCPHPVEDSDSVTKISQKLGVRLSSELAPIEIRIINAQENPARIGLFYSSAFQTVSTIFGNIIPVDVFYPVRISSQSGVEHVDRVNLVYGKMKERVVYPNRFYSQTQNEWLLENSNNI